MRSALPLLSPLLFVVACDALTLGAPDATAEDFGFGTMTIDGLPAEGERPVLIVRLDYPDVAFRGDHAVPSTFDDLVFGPEPSVRTYLEANSNGMFTIASVGTIAVTHPDTLACAHNWDLCTDPQTADPRGFLGAHQTALELAMADPSLDLSIYDADGDMVVRQSELMILFYQALPADPTRNPYGSTGGLARSFPDGCVTSDAQSVSYCGGFTTVGEGSGVDTVAHELTHLLGPVDLYGNTCRNNNLSLMSCTINPDNEEDAHEWIHLDPWHKLKLGWLRIEGYAIGQERTLAANLYDAEDEPQVIALFDEAIGTESYQILERRDPAAAHDTDAADEGVAVWQVVESGGVPAPVMDGGREEPGVYLLSAPGQAHAGSRLWNDSHGTVPLQWHDGTETGATLEVGPLEDGRYRRITVGL